MAPHKSHDQWNPVNVIIVLPDERNKPDDHSDADERDEKGTERPTRGARLSNCSSRNAATMEIPRINST
jgi:hypothetical protein